MHTRSSIATGKPAELLQEYVGYIQRVSCGHPIRVHSTYCRLCGTLQIEAGHASPICGNSRRPNRHDASFCTNCGDRLLT